MKKRFLLVLPIAALFASCGNINTGGAMDMSATLTGSEVAVNVVNVYKANTDGSKGTYINSRVRSFTLTQPRLDVAVRPASLGFTASKVTVKYTDASGNAFGDTASTFTNAVAFAVPKGYNCSVSGACDTSNVNPVPQTFQQSQLYVISDAIAVTAARSCVDGSYAVASGYVCPEVRMNAVFSGKTSANTDNTLTASPAQIWVHVASVTDEVVK